MPSQTTQQTQSPTQTPSQTPQAEPSAQVDNSQAVEQAGLTTGSGLFSAAGNLMDALDILPEEQGVQTLRSLPLSMALGLSGLAFGHPSYLQWLRELPGAVVGQSPALCNKMLQRWLSVGTEVVGRGGFKSQGAGIPMKVQTERWLGRPAEDKGQMGALVEFSSSLASESGPEVTGAGGDVLGGSGGADLKVTHRVRLIAEVPELARSLVNQLGPAAFLGGQLDIFQALDWAMGRPPEVLEHETELGASAAVELDIDELAGGPLEDITGLGAQQADRFADLGIQAGTGVTYTSDMLSEGYRLRIEAGAEVSLEPGSPLAVWGLDEICALISEQAGVAVGLSGRFDPNAGWLVEDCYLELDEGAERRRLEFGANRGALAAFLAERLSGASRRDPGPDDIGARLQASGLVALTRTLRLPMEGSELDEVVPDWMVALEAIAPDQGVVRGVNQIELWAEARVDAAAVIAAYRGVRFVQPEPDLEPTRLAEDILRGVLAHALAGQEPPAWLPAPRSEAELFQLKTPRLVGQVSFGAGFGLSTSAGSVSTETLDMELRVDARYEGEIEAQRLAEREPQLR